MAHAYVGHFELLVCVSDFRNVDLSEQGFYSIRINVSKERPKPKNNGGGEEEEKGKEGPVIIIEPRSLMKTTVKKGIKKDHDVFPALLEENGFRTRTFLVRFVEETVSIHEAAMFHLKIPFNGRKDLSHQSLFLKFELLYTPKDKGAESVEKDGGVRCVARTHIRLSSIAQGVCCAHVLKFHHPFTSTAQIVAFGVLSFVDILSPSHFSYLPSHSLHPPQPPAHLLASPPHLPPQPLEPPSVTVSPFLPTSSSSSSSHSPVVFHDTPPPPLPAHPSLFWGPPKHFPPPPPSLFPSPFVPFSTKNNECFRCKDKGRVREEKVYRRCTGCGLLFCPSCQGPLQTHPPSCTSSFLSSSSGCSSSSSPSPSPSSFSSFSSLSASSPSCTTTSTSVTNSLSSSTSFYNSPLSPSNPPPSFASCSSLSQKQHKFPKPIYSSSPLSLPSTFFPSSKQMEETFQMKEGKNRRRGRRVSSPSLSYAKERERKLGELWGCKGCGAQGTTNAPLSSLSSSSPLPALFFCGLCGYFFCGCCQASDLPCSPSFSPSLPHPHHIFFLKREREKGYAFSAVTFSPPPTPSPTSPPIHPPTSIRPTPARLHPPSPSHLHTCSPSPTSTPTLAPTYIPAPTPTPIPIRPPPPPPSPVRHCLPSPTPSHMNSSSPFSFLVGWLGGGGEERGEERGGYLAPLSSTPTFASKEGSKGRAFSSFSFSPQSPPVSCVRSQHSVMGEREKEKAVGGGFLHEYGFGDGDDDDDNFCDSEEFPTDSFDPSDDENSPSPLSSSFSPSSSPASPKKLFLSPTQPSHSSPHDHFPHLSLPPPSSSSCSPPPNSSPPQPPSSPLTSLSPSSHSPSSFIPPLSLSPTSSPPILKREEEVEKEENNSDLEDEWGWAWKSEENGRKSTEKKEERERVETGKKTSLFEKKKIRKNRGMTLPLPPSFPAPSPSSSSPSFPSPSSPPSSLSPSSPSPSSPSPSSPSSPSPLPSPSPSPSPSPPPPFRSPRKQRTHPFSFCSPVSPIAPLLSSQRQNKTSTVPKPTSSPSSPALLSKRSNTEYFVSPSRVLSPSNPSTPPHSPTLLLSPQRSLRLTDQGKTKDNGPRQKQPPTSLPSFPSSPSHPTTKPPPALSNPPAPIPPSPPPRSPRFPSPPLSYSSPPSHSLPTFPYPPSLVPHPSLPPSSLPPSLPIKQTLLNSSQTKPPPSPSISSLRSTKSDSFSRFTHLPSPPRRGSPSSPSRGSPRFRRGPAHSPLSPYQNLSVTIRSSYQLMLLNLEQLHGFYDDALMGIRTGQVKPFAELVKNQLGEDIGGVVEDLNLAKSSREMEGCLSLLRSCTTSPSSPVPPVPDVKTINEEIGVNLNRAHGSFQQTCVELRLKEIMKMWLGVIEKEIFQIWKLFLCLFCVVEGNFGKRMVEEGEEKRRERWGDFIFQNKLVLKEPGDLFVGCRGEWEEGKEGIHRWRATRVALKKKMEKLLGARQTQGEVEMFEDMVILDPAYPIPLLYEEPFGWFKEEQEEDERRSGEDKPRKKTIGKKKEEFLFPPSTRRGKDKEKDRMKREKEREKQNETLYCRAHSHTSSVPGVHLVVFLHGLMGNRRDLRQWRHILGAKMQKNFEYLLIRSLEDATHQPIMKQGELVAKEINNYIKTHSLHLSRLSFVCHSLGGLVARSCLLSPSFTHLLPLLHTYLSLATPHLGALYGGTSGGGKREYKGAMGMFVPSAIWLYQKWTQSSSLQQLRVEDASDPRDTFLYRLARDDLLHEFQNIVLVASPQDVYVNSPSALIDPVEGRDGGEGEGEGGAGGGDRVFGEMVQNIFRKISQKKRTVLRIDALTPFQEKDWVGMKGRAAHINFLDSETLIQMVVDCYGYIFY